MRNENAIYSRRPSINSNSGAVEKHQESGCAHIHNTVYAFARSLSMPKCICAQRKKKWVAARAPRWFIAVIWILLERVCVVFHARRRNNSGGALYVCMWHDPKQKSRNANVRKQWEKRWAGGALSSGCARRRRPLHISSYTRDLYTDAGYKEMTRINLQLFLRKYTHTFRGNFTTDSSFSVLLVSLTSAFAPMSVPLQIY